MKNFYFATLCCCAILTTTAAAAPAPKTGNSLPIWSRSAGNYADNLKVDKTNSQDINIDTLKLEEISRFDVQYGKEQRFKGIFVRKILRNYKKASHDDMVVLHFENGMVVPVPLSGALRKIDPFLALEFCEKARQCSPKFPEISHEDAYSVTADPRPITFSSNKLIVDNPWHPSTEGRDVTFSPWHHVNSLTGIEFVNAAAYFRQFDFGDAQGLSVFRKRCQFCHGVRQVGANFGWDFVTPLPIHQKRSPEQLLNHVKYPKAFGRKMGLLMPNQSDVTIEEMRATWRWMGSAEKQKSMTYTP